MIIVAPTNYEIGKRGGMIDPSALVAARNAKGLSTSDLARLVGCSQQLISAIENGTTRSTKFLPRIALALDVSPGQIDSDWGDVAAPAKSAIVPVENPMARDVARDFPVYSAAMGGPGEIIRSTEPVDWIPRPAPVQHVKQAYGQIVVGTSMFPEYDEGDTALVNPKLPPLPGTTCIFYHEASDGEARATIKRLVRIGVDVWHVRQWNPPEGESAEFQLDRREWAIVHRVFGKHTRY